MITVESAYHFKCSIPIIEKISYLLARLREDALNYASIDSSAIERRKDLEEYSGILLDSDCRQSYIDFNHGFDCMVAYKNIPGGDKEERLYASGLIRESYTTLKNALDEDYNKRSFPAENRISKINTIFPDSTYITCTQAVSYLAFGDFETLDRYHKSKKESKWGTSDKKGLLSAFKLIAENKQVIECEAGIKQLEIANHLLKENTISIGKLIQELKDDINKSNREFQMIRSAEGALLNAMIAGKAKVIGKQNKKGKVDLLPQEIPHSYLLNNPTLTSCNNCLWFKGNSDAGELGHWEQLQVNRYDVLDLYADQVKNRGVYISAVEAVSWIAFKDFDYIESIFQEYPPHEKKELLGSLNAIKNNEILSDEEWYGKYGISREKTESTIKEANKPIDDIISELSASMEAIEEQYKESIKKIDLAWKDLLENLLGKKLDLYGVNENDKSKSVKISDELLRLTGLSINYKCNQLSTIDCGDDLDFIFTPEENLWGDLQIKRAEVVKLWGDDHYEKLQVNNASYGTEPLLPYTSGKSLISINEAIEKICQAVHDASFLGSEAEKKFTEALKHKKVKAVAVKGQEIYILPTVFWEKSHNSSFAVGAFKAFSEGKVDNMVDMERIANLHHIQGWAIAIEEESFQLWLDNEVIPQRIDEIFNSETHWNAIQALGWIIFRDPIFVVSASNKTAYWGTYWEEHVLPSGKQMVEILNTCPGLIHLSLRDGFSADKPAILSYPEARTQLIGYLQSGTICATGYRNNEGDPVRMTQNDWLNADFYEYENDKIYVSAEDHKRAIGRTMWYGVTFNKADILNIWLSDTTLNEILSFPEVLNKFIKDYTAKNKRKAGAGRSDKFVYEAFVSAHSQYRGNVFSHNSVVFREAWKNNNQWKTRGRIAADA
jgi:hypothetical protein